MKTFSQSEFCLRSSLHAFGSHLFCIALLVCWAAQTWCQSEQPQDSLAQTAQPEPKHDDSAGKTNTAEITAHDQPATFKVNVKLVVVRAVVRDPQGHAIGNLHQEDFQIFDRGKPQVITQFEVQQPGDLTARARLNSTENSGAVTPSEPISITNAAAPERFVAYVFDDVHLEFGDLARVRDAAERQFDKLRPTDRVAIFTTSGQNNLDFTDDRAKVHQALSRLMPRSISVSQTSGGCPDISHYAADMVVNKNDPYTASILTQEMVYCMRGIDQTAARVLVESQSQVSLENHNHETQVSLTVLKGVVRDLSHMPGQRSMVLVSPGFLAPQMEFDYNDVIDLAVRSQVVIHTLDARGLYVDQPFGDASNSASYAPQIAGQMAMLNASAAAANDDLLANFAASTGGAFFHNSNDYDAGFRQTGQAPEYSYVLAFVPQDLKLDGSYHELRCKLKASGKMSVQARRGYFAPKHLANPEEQAKQEIEEALYSQDELHNLPVKLHTQFFKVNEQSAKLIVLTHVDVQHMHYRKADGRNNDVLTCVSAVFNRNGNFVEATEKTVTMNWKDETLDQKLASGITLKSSFDVKPGNYLVRLVVRDSEGQLMSAENGTVEIR
jgi:VWFA-related protein